LGLKIEQMSKVIAVANQKGGVGKTFLTFHLAHFLVEKGFRVLVIDLDPQGNLSLVLKLLSGWRPSCQTAEIFSSENISFEEIQAGLRLVSSDITLARYEASSGGVNFYFKLRRALKKYLAREPEDFVLLDCPPSLGLFSLSAFVAAESLLIPLKPEIFSISGLGDLLRVAEEVKEDINPSLRIMGLVLNAIQKRTRIGRNIQAELAENVSIPVLAQFPASIKAEEAMRRGEPVWKVAFGTPLAKALREGLTNIWQRL